MCRKSYFLFIVVFFFVFSFMFEAVSPGAHKFSGSYTKENLSYLAYPLGGIGTGNICIQGNGQLGRFCLRKFKPSVYDDPVAFSAICIKNKDKQNKAKVLEGPVPSWKIFGHPDGAYGLGSRTYGLPRFEQAEFSQRFPFANIKLADADLPLDVDIQAWSPFIPLDPNNSSLPVAAIEYRFINTTEKTVRAVYSFNAANFMHVPESGGRAGVSKINKGFVLYQEPDEAHPANQGYFAAFVDSPKAQVDPAWFRGGWFDMLTILWKNIAAGELLSNPAITKGRTSPGGSVYVPLEIAPGDSEKVTLMFAWYLPQTNLRFGKDAEKNGNEDRSNERRTRPRYHIPWYAGKFDDINEVIRMWRAEYNSLKEKTRSFTDCFYDNTLPGVVVEAIAANMTTLKTTTVLRQRDGRLWCFEGCRSCWGSCTHVWNYAQAIPHLFPCLERGLRRTEFNESLDEKGHQAFRSALPIRPIKHDFLSAADGQLGCIMKVYREWRISGDSRWLEQYWPKVKRSLDYCIKTWDPNHKGVLCEPHHNTYDIEFWGPDGMCSSFYLGALKAAAKMGSYLDDPQPQYEKLYDKGKTYLENELFNGEYFYQKVITEGLGADPLEFKGLNNQYSPEALELLKKEGPKYQYGTGCLSDGVLGAWLAYNCRVGAILDSEKVKSHLNSVYKYNFKSDLSSHCDTQRPGFAMQDDGGLLLCSWPNGNKPSLPFVYSDEVWTGIEYQVASHLMAVGSVEKGLRIVRAARERYDGTIRNPFNEYECGNHYARAMASYAILQALSGAQYDAVEKTLYLSPSLKGDFRCFISTATGYGTAGIENGKPFVDAVSGRIPVARIEYTPAP